MSMHVDIAALEVASAGATKKKVSLARDLVALTKPRVTTLVIATMLGGISLAAHTSGKSPSTRAMLFALLGTVLVVGGANALNMYLERDTDALMERTRDRPLPSKRIAPALALALGFGLSAVSIPILTFAVNAMTGLLAAIALVSYVLVYTPLKRKSSVALFVGAIPGAIPPLLGWTSVTGSCELPGVILFGILFFWQLPHFLAIATFRRDDYARAGLLVMPVERGDRTTRVHIVVHTVLLIAVTLALVPAGVGSLVYIACASGLGAAFLAMAVFGLKPGAGASWAKSLFLASMVYLVLLFVALGASA